MSALGGCAPREVMAVQRAVVDVHLPDGSHNPRYSSRIARRNKQINGTEAERAPPYSSLHLSSPMTASGKRDPTSESA